MALKEHDQKQIYVARQNLFDLRNVYAILTDILHKNINKVRHASERASTKVAYSYLCSSGRQRATIRPACTESQALRSGLTPHGMLLRQAPLP